MTRYRHRAHSSPARHLAVAGAVLAVAAVSISACSSSAKSTGAASTGASTTSSATSPTSSTASACVAAANAYLAPWNTLAMTLPAAYTPLSKKPTPGGTIIQLVGPIPSDAESQAEQAVAAKAIGWTGKKITFNGTVEDLNAKFEQAISQKPTAIALSGYPVAAIQTPLQDAQKAGVVVSLSSITDPPTAIPGYAALSNGGATINTIATLEANKFMQLSNCAGSVAFFSLPYPIVALAASTFTSVVESKCAGCKVSTTVIQTADIGTPAATTAMVSKLQSDPSIKYVDASIANLAAGLSTALAQANLTGISIFGSVPDNNAINALQNKTNAFWVDQSSLMNGWTMLDGALRAIDSGKTVTDNGSYPLALLTPQNVPAGHDLPVYPSDFRDEFTKLWLVG